MGDKVRATKPDTITEPAKTKPGYANFAIENPPLNRVLRVAHQPDDLRQHAVGADVAVGDGTDVELVEVGQVDGEGLGHDLAPG